MLIKNAAAHAVLPFGAARSSSGERVMVAQAPDEAGLLRVQVERLEATIEEMTARSAGECEIAREEGRRSALLDASEAEAKHLEALASGIRDAVQSWQTRLSGWDALSAELARAGLAKLFSEWEVEARFVSRTVARKLAGLRREAIVAIRVSRQDFSDDDALDALSLEIDGARLALVADPELPPGGCRIDLRLGHVELGMREQAADLDALFTLVVRDEADR